MAIGPDPPAGSTPNVRRIWRETYLRYGRRVSNWGVFVCRHIAGSSTWSQHAWGNAWDIGGSRATLDDVAQFLRSSAMRPWVRQVLWRVPDHHDHIHVDARPKMVGVPPCASRQRPPEDQPERQAPLPTQTEVTALESSARYITASTRSWSRQGAAITDVGRRIRRIMR